MNKEIQVIDFAYLRMCAEHDYIYETGEAKLLLNYITNLQQENSKLKEKYENIINRYKFIKNRINQGMSIENKNKCLIELGNNILQELKESDVSE